MFQYLHIVDYSVLSIQKSCWVDLYWTELTNLNSSDVKCSLKSEMNWTELNATELNWTDFELRKNEKARPMHAANTSIILIQSGHIFLQIILLIISKRSIAALNQSELWVHSLCLWQSNTARLCDSQREHHLTPSISSLSLSSSLFLTLCASAFLRVWLHFKSLLSLDSLYLWFQFSTSLNLAPVFLIKSGWNYWTHGLPLH